MIRSLGAATTPQGPWEITFDGSSLRVGPDSAFALDTVHDVQVRDTSITYRATPTWAIILGIIGLLVFLIGIVLFFVKETRTNQQVTVTVYTADQAYPMTVPNVSTQWVYDKWYPFIAAVQERQRARAAGATLPPPPPPSLGR